MPFFSILQKVGDLLFTNLFFLNMNFYTVEVEHVHGIKV